ncbi:hypothetical protein [Rhodobacter sp. CZR27]|uniref:hypothetical protein n=1 Tax=Rhodobacter sp. CZR27 TaxID=2033869 RepID=UPI000BBEB227|nr:hypothetical protein [Rhodobacter sp. CZR27]
MKIIFSRNQKDLKGLLGGHKGVRFELGAIAEITDEERALCSQYMPSSTHLYTWEYRKRPGAIAQSHSIYVETLLKGQKFECEDIAEILFLEGKIVEAAKEFRSYLSVAKSFGGTVEVEIN